MTKAQQTFVLLHGGAMSGASLRPIAKRLSHIRCLTPDLRGHGTKRSLAFSNLEQCADDIACLIASETDRPVHLFGLSLGGYVSLNLLAQQKVPIASAIITGVAFADIRAKWLLRHVIGLVYPMLCLKSTREMAGRLTGINDAKLMSDPGSRGWARPSTVRDLARDILRCSPLELAKRVSAPSLFLAGAYEPSAVRRGLELVRAECASASAGIVEAGSHGWCINDPGFAALVIERWLRGESLPPGIDLTGSRFDQI